MSEAEAGVPEAEVISVRQHFSADEKKKLEEAYMKLEDGAPYYAAAAAVAQTLTMSSRCPRRVRKWFDNRRQLETKRAGTKRVRKRIVKA